MKQGYTLAVIAVVIALTAIWWRMDAPRSDQALDAFAKCLTQKGIVMYGADWCGHCQNEKSAFGSSFRFVNYIECPKEPERCLAAGINGYPTWTFSDGRKLEGEQGLEKLAEESDCLLENIKARK
ncbi:hypothetical protein HYV91_01460 [Candidatus Wolfebacteria bacterium]|nr:hypothetical protein [Candidatus Wolfebacteria bacterium]